MKCNKKNCPLVGNNENCDIKDCKWRTEDATDTDLIRRSDALETYAELYDIFDDSKAIQEELHKVFDKINSIPAVEPKQGEWIDIWEDGRSTKAVCNTCGRVSDRPLGDFCKWCGVTMKGADE